MTRAWTTPDDIAARVRRRWADGSLLRGYTGSEPFEPIEIPIRGPRAAEIGDDLEAVRGWMAALDAGRRDDRRYKLTWHPVGGRRIGRNMLPSRAIISSLDQAWTLLGVRESVGRFDEIVRLVGGHPPVRDWVVDHPLRALDLHDEMARLVCAYEWLDAHRGSGRYLREITAPGVDTKFAEKHRVVLAAMLGVPSRPAGFLASLGLAAKPEFIRLRPAQGLGLPAQGSEFAMRVAELSALPLRPRTAIIVENEVSYLSLVVPEDGTILWGKGFEVDRVGSLRWLSDADVTYWGDIDTHGFAILDRLRAWLPQTRSALMDRATLLTHRDRWGREERPAHSSLTRLTAAEQDLYADLVTDALGERVRLEQERIDWAWVAERFAQ